MAVNKRAAGADKEQLAARYLVDNGYTVLERNFRNKTGEIDIIAKKDNYIVFVEVKYRSNNKYGYAVEAVNYRKKQIIRHVAQFYMATRYKSCDIPCRFDAVSYTHLTLPTKRIVEISVDVVSLKKKRQKR